MKQVFTVIILILMLCLTFAGCGNSNNQTEDNNLNNQTEDNNLNNQHEQTQEGITKMYITINNNKLKVNLAKNSSVDALVEILKQGNIVYTANDYGDFEKVGNIGHTLPTNNSQITTEAGDVMLYLGNQIVLFYGNNAWSYTRIGKIEGYSQTELRSLLCAGHGSVQVTISLD